MSLSCSRLPSSLFFSQTSPVLLSVIVPLPLSVKLKGAPARISPSSGTATGPGAVVLVRGVGRDLPGGRESPGARRAAPHSAQWWPEALSDGDSVPPWKPTYHAMPVLLAHVVDDQ